MIPFFFINNCLGGYYNTIFRNICFIAYNYNPHVYFREGWENFHNFNFWSYFKLENKTSVLLTVMYIHWQPNMKKRKYIIDRINTV